MIASIKNCLLAVALLGATALVGCKTNEKNMYDAYEKAIAGQAERDAEDADIYLNIRREMQHSTMRVGNDSIDVSTQWVRATENGGGTREDIKRYCVVVAQFKQAFNARSMQERLSADGYPGCFIVETREPYYFVVVASYDEINPAVEMLHKVEKDKIFHFKSPLPFILRPSQIR